MRLVQVEVRSVSLAHRDDLRQRRELPFHRVDPLDDDQHLLPGPARPRLPARHVRPQDALERVDVVVGEDGDLRAGPAGAADDRRVVERVRDEEAPGPDQDGQDRRVGREAHAEAEGRGLAQEGRELFLQIQVELRRPRLSSRGARGPPFLFQGLERARGAVRVVGGEAQIVVAPEVERPDPVARQLQRPLPAHGRPLQHVDVRVGRGPDRPVPAVVDAVEHAAGVKVLVVLSDGHVALGQLALGPGEEVAEKVADVAEQEEEGPADCFWSRRRERRKKEEVEVEVERLLDRDR